MKAYSISEIAALMNIAPSAIRFYDKEGLLPNVEKVNGRRVFREKDFAWLKVLNCLKTTGMPIREIRRYVELAEKGDETLEERFSIILKQKENILSQIDTLNKQLKVIEYKEWFYRTSIDAGTEKIHENDPHTLNLEPDTIPKEKMEE